MKVIRTIPHDKYNCEKIIEIFTSDFCKRARWTEENNYITHGNENKYVVEDNIPVEVNWRVRNGEFLDPNFKVLEDLKIDKLAEIAESRFKAETAGTVINGITVRTDRESQAMMTGAAFQAANDPNYTVNWKSVNGFVTLNSQAVIGVALAVRTHVQGCFDKENLLVTQINAAQTIEEIEAISW